MPSAGQSSAANSATTDEVCAGGCLSCYQPQVDLKPQMCVFACFSSVLIWFQSVFSSPVPKTKSPVRADLCAGP